MQVTDKPWLLFEDFFGEFTKDEKGPNAVG